jgi:Tfp pilus assembly protein FimT
MSKSFTLIELLVTTTIILIFGGLSLAYYNNFTQEKSLKKETQKLVNAIELAKKKANSGEVQNCSSFCGYQFSVNSNSYAVNICCACNSNGNCANPTPIITYSLPSNIKSLNSFATMFKPLSSLVTPGSIKLKNNNINQCEQISINQAGVVENQKINCPPPTPTPNSCVPPGGFGCSDTRPCCDGRPCIGHRCID